MAIGVAKPDRIIAGTKNRNAPSSPCCWVTEMEDIISPTPIPDKRKSSSPAYSAGRLPLKGTSNQNVAMRIMSVASDMPMKKPGRVLPSRISMGRRGVTRS